MPNSKLAVSSYKRLIQDIAILYEGSRRALVEAYWKIGQRIVEVEQKGEIKAAYGSSLLRKLSDDLTERLGSGFSTDNLLRMRKFYLTYPKTATLRKLDWCHFVELIKIREGKKRAEIERKVFAEELSIKEIRALVGRELVREQVAENLKEWAIAPEAKKAVELLKVPKLGFFYTYLIKDPKDVAWPDKNVLLLDHGFKVYRVLASTESRLLKAGAVVEWNGTKLIKSRRTARDLFTYRAYLESVIDGDTLWVMLDIGMEGASRQKLRLRGIDCPEIDTEEGRLAKKFVEETLKDVPHLTVLTSRPTYDRYEADVWFVDKAGKELYLNNLILESGYAVEVGE